VSIIYSLAESVSEKPHVSMQYY